MKTENNYEALEGRDERKKVIASADIDNRVNWPDYHINGDIDEIRSVARVHGIINIGVDDIISMLSTKNANYVTSGTGVGPDRIPAALNHAIHRLPVELQHIGKMIVNVWTSEFKPVLMSEIVAMVKHLEDILPEIELIWGVAVDTDMNENVKITLIAAGK